MEISIQVCMTAQPILLPYADILGVRTGASFDPLQGLDF